MIVSVPLGERSYPIIIEAGARKFGQVLERARFDDYRVTALAQGNGNDHE